VAAGERVCLRPATAWPRPREPVRPRWRRGPRPADRAAHWLAGGAARTPALRSDRAHPFDPVVLSLCLPGRTRDPARLADAHRTVTASRPRARVRARARRSRSQTQSARPLAPAEPRSRPTPSARPQTRPHHRRSGRAGDRLEDVGARAISEELKFRHTLDRARCRGTWKLDLGCCSQQPPRSTPSASSSSRPPAAVYGVGSDTRTAIAGLRSAAPALPASAGSTLQFLTGPSRSASTASSARSAPPRAL